MDPNSICTYTFQALWWHCILMAFGRLVHVWLHRPVWWGEYITRNLSVCGQMPCTCSEPHSKLGGNGICFSMTSDEFACLTTGLVSLYSRIKVIISCFDQSWESFLRAYIEDNNARMTLCGLNIKTTTMITEQGKYYYWISKVVSVFTLNSFVFSISPLWRSRHKKM